MPEDSTPETPQPLTTPPQPESIRAFDQDGNEVQVPRAQWIGEILPAMLKEQWDNPEALYAIILNSLNDGFAAEIAPAAQRLYETDPVPARGVCMWAIVLMQTNRLDEAEPVMSNFLVQHGEDGSVLVNLARYYALKDDHAQAEATLRRALEAEPNLDNGLGWYISIEGERGGVEAAKAALERIAAMPGSWRAQLWLAREELQAQNLGHAREYYTDALARSPRPLSPDFLMQMSGDLGGGGHLADLIAFTAPEYLPEVHGLPIANNLIKAYVDTGNLEAADQVRQSLLAFDRPDWRDALNFWESEIAKRRAGSQPAGTPPAGTESNAQDQQQIQLGMLRVDGPVWLPPQSPARSIFGIKPQGPSVTFLGGTAEGPEDPAQAANHAEAISRWTRALPLFLAEQVDMRTAAHGRAVLPWAVAQAPGQPSGFIVSGARWPDQVALQMVSDQQNATDYVVSVHLDAEVEPWTADLAFLRTTDGTRIGEITAEFPGQDPASGIDRLTHEVVELLSALGSASTPAVYTPPTGPLLGSYMLRLEQLLSLRTSTMEGAAPMTEEQQQVILAGEAQLCEAAPESVPARLLLVETLGAFTRLAPPVAAAFQPEFERLMTTHPLAAIDTIFSRS